MYEHIKFINLRNNPLSGKIEFECRSEFDVRYFNRGYFSIKTRNLSVESSNSPELLSSTLFINGRSYCYDDTRLSSNPNQFLVYNYARVVANHYLNKKRKQYEV